MSNRNFHGWRKYEKYLRNGGKKGNVRVLRSFEEEVKMNVRAVQSMSLSYVAPALLQSMVNQAGYSDYTGVLSNSYMAGMFVNGKYAGDRRGLFLPDTWSGNPRAFWSSNEPGIKTIRIKRGRPYVKKGVRYNNGFLRRYRHSGEEGIRKGKDIRYMIQKRTYRNPLSTEFMTFDKKDFRSDGWGRDVTVLRGAEPVLKRGTEIIVTNGAPYADKVQNNNSGSNVMPKGIGGQFHSIVRGELEKNLGKVLHKFTRK